MNFGTDEDGKAEAEATVTSSRATVSGKNGMGQAQSQSTGSDCGAECCGVGCGGISGGGDYYTDSQRPDPLTSVADGRVVQDSSRYPGGGRYIPGGALVTGDGGRHPVDSHGRPGDTRQVQLTLNVSEINENHEKSSSESKIIPMDDQYMCLVEEVLYQGV